MSNKWKSLISSRKFWTNFGLVIGLFGLLSFVFFLIMNVYTRHGSKIAIPNLVNQPIALAEQLSDSKGFSVVINDSIFVVGKPGGVVLSQNPNSGSFAKSGRKIYITVSKFVADMVSVSALPTLYGKSYHLKKKSLEEGFELVCDVVGYEFDQGSPDQILKVICGTDTIINKDQILDKYQIPRGGVLKFILSTQEGGYSNIPDLVCRKFPEASFMVTSSGFLLKIRVGNGNQTEYVTAQEPNFQEGLSLKHGDTIFVDLGDRPPPHCGETSSDDEENVNE